MTIGEKLSLTVEIDVATRLDNYLAAALDKSGKVPGVSRAQIKRWVESGAIKVNGVLATKAGANLKNGALVEIDSTALAGPELERSDMQLEIIFEDDEVIVINKPAGLVVHPGAGNRTGTLVNALLSHCKNLPKTFGDPGRPGIVHRLDKDTSGIVVVAKTVNAHKVLAAQFAKHTVGRAYYALVFSTPRANREIQHSDIGLVDAAIGRHPGRRTEMAVLREGGKRAVTHWRVIERLTYGTLLELRLETGRTHQIRVHMKSIGCPVIGDPVYGDFSGLPAPQKRAAELFAKQALHAFRLDFDHPSSTKRLSFSSELPKDFKELLISFGSDKGGAA